MERINVGDSIESEGATLIARRLSAMPPCHDPALGKMVYNAAIRDNANATVRIELSPKEPIKSLTSLIDVGDKILGDTILCISVKRFPSPSAKPRTGRHKSQEIETRKYTYACVDKVWQPLQNQIQSNVQ